MYAVLAQLPIAATSVGAWSDRIAGFALWCGLAALGVALLVLMRTHWGQARPMSKCVALSLFAHFLLFMYAYGTHLLTPEPRSAPDRVMQVALVDTDTGPRADENPKRHVAADDTDSDAPTPWERLPAGEVQLPTAPDKSPAEVAVLATTTPVAQADWSAPVSETIEIPADHPVLPPTAVPQVAPPDARRPDFRASRVQAATIEQPITSPAAATVDTSNSDMPQPERLPVDLPPSVPSSGPELPSPIDASRMQQLAAVAPRPETADTRAGQQDLPEQAENRANEPDAAGRSPTVAGDRTAAGSRPAAPGLVTIPHRPRPATAAPAPAAAATSRETLASIARQPVRRLGDGDLLPASYRLRNLASDSPLAQQLGATAQSCAAVDAALKWLAAQQETDGHWDADRWGAGLESRTNGPDRRSAGTRADTGLTGLVLLSFLARGHTHYEGNYRQTVQHALEYLIGQQAADGNLAGNATLYAKMYCHGMAALALSETLAMTGDVRLREAVTRAVGYSVKAQHPTTGGWRYQPGDPGDMSQFGWQVMALKSAALAGVPTPQTTREGMLYFLQQCEHGQTGGLASYRPGSGPTRAMTAESLVCRYFLDLVPDDSLVDEVTGYLMQEPPSGPTPNLYYWYYGTLALFHQQGPVWKQWNRALQQELLPRQRIDGHLAGSWNPDSVWGAYGGRVYSTAVATLSLEVYFRYLPTLSEDRPANTARWTHSQWR